MPLWTDPRPTVLLTGFGPFPGVPKNVSGSLVKWLAFRARVALPHVRFVAAILPTEWMRAPRELTALYDRHDPVLALHFGVASDMRGFRIETEARNVCRPSPDAAGALPPLALISEADALSIPVTIDAKFIAQHLSSRGYYATLSDDAGGYLCNAILYRSLVEARQRRQRCKVGFIHISADAALLDVLDYATSGAFEILKLSLEMPRRAAALTSV
ncbi:pyroglutamyl-peptidase I [Hyphomicrobium sp.]|jgi:pyroglutamyl-peptidase|uniref:pyroglutamyl-peptidase I family protein n=1 Tax=Hyphomicrobium sp. TaxID=82 RepID=UPI002CB0D2D8|nr:pyroglutamyl-peptidase I [Hyphomicrobium sp.]HVZ03472.1 pyroglutamyl-peptidase I [Hyphomicrobium sp.]